LKEFHAEFHANLTRYKEKRVYCTRYENTHFSPSFWTPLAQGTIILKSEFEFGLHMPVKFHQDPLRFARVIRESRF